MTFVAFFRNVNLGHPGSPGSAQIVDAFGGPEVAANFQTNGTVVFRGASPAKTARRARKTLADAGIERGFVVRSLAQVKAVVDAFPEGDPDDGSHRILVSFFDLPAEPVVSDDDMRGADGRLDVLTIDATHAVSASRRRGDVPGDPTSHLERVLGVPVTTRGIATLQRLVARENR